MGRLAHFISETNARLAAIGYSDGKAFGLTINQTDLGEITGLTAIHVTRVLRMLREERICAFRSSRVEIADLPRLEQIGQFDPTYLNLKNRSADPPSPLGEENSNG